ncbi:MAG TPA: 3-deoxy-manno-octulosonate cytidylyltransferase [Vicinamibacterales bacterium]|nr:3-deoxy-manno-octulosonate cytidylyltransferase [Vicinamibacterales bacterium]
MPPVSDTGPSSFRVSVSAIAIIPARYQSTRLPGKALADIAGRPMIEHVYRRASAARSVSRVIVATDDRRIVEAVEAFGGDVRLTSASHQSGTDRLAEVAASLDCDLVVNVQGDEPVLAPETIDAAVAPFSTLAEATVDKAATFEMTTLRRRITDPAELKNPNVTKVVVDREGFAMYFSRAPIPFTRPGQPEAPAWAHVGLYVYRRETLLRLAALPPTALERAEALEQLRALEHGIRIKAIETTHDTIGVDTPEDLARVRALLAHAITT